MSMESAKAFVERMKTDSDFAQKVAECKSPESRMQLVKAEGFDFTPEEVKKASGELSEDDLELVSGGSIGSFAKEFAEDAVSLLVDCIGTLDVCR